MFRGREQSHPERGTALLMRLAEDVAELGTVEQRPIQDGRNMTMLLAPVPKKQGDTSEKPAVEATESRAAEAGRGRPSRPRPLPKPPSPPSWRLLQYSVRSCRR